MRRTGLWRFVSTKCATVYPTPYDIQLKIISSMKVMICLLKISELLQTELAAVRLAVGQILKVGLT
jgi:hypothetical protein